MKNGLAISAHNIGKEYRIGRQVSGYRTFRETLVDVVNAPFRRIKSVISGQASVADQDSFWALRNISFDVPFGETLGIIGPNGAGKSTLLKVLSRITKPSEGFVDVRGRVGSLLEVGTGFHPELTGRENIYLNGSVLGMGRKEIERKFDEIVDFSGVGKFLDTPVKHYSSGMYVRLAFSVAAHMRTEVLIVDEVLAVGDSAFQKKCLGKMGSVAGEGRTVIFVSHNMGAVKSLCDRGILIEAGELVYSGPVKAVVERYLTSVLGSKDSSYSQEKELDEKAWVSSITLKSDDGQPRDSFLMTEPIIVECGIEIREFSQLTLSVQIKEMDNSAIFHFPNGDADIQIPSEPGSYTILLRIPPLGLYPARYGLRFALTDTVTNRQEEIEGVSFLMEQDFSVCSRPLIRRAGLIFDRPEWWIK